MTSAFGSKRCGAGPRRVEQSGISRLRLLPAHDDRAAPGARGDDGMLPRRSTARIGGASRKRERGIMPFDVGIDEIRRADPKPGHAVRIEELERVRKEPEPGDLVTQLHFVGQSRGVRAADRKDVLRSRRRWNMNEIDTIRQSVPVDDVAFRHFPGDRTSTGKARLDADLRVRLLELERQIGALRKRDADLPRDPGHVRTENRRESSTAFGDRSGNRWRKERSFFRRCGGRPPWPRQRDGAAWSRHVTRS